MDGRLNSFVKELNCPTQSASKSLEQLWHGL